MGTVIALGNFDGVHLAHAALIQMTTAYAHAAKSKSLAYVLDPHPKSLLLPKQPPKLLMTTAQKTKRLLEAGADEVFLEKRGMEILSLSPEAFIKDILIGEFSAVCVVAGYNYRFGKQAAGDATLLKTLCDRYGIACHILENMERDGYPISSTRLRALLENGEIEAYNALSFAPYTLSGQVQSGKRLGRQIGFPTMNIEIPPALLLPKKGVYISRTHIDGKTYASVTNIGQNPTVEKAVPRAESYLFGFVGEAYGSESETELITFLRAECRFESIEALKRQMRQDVEETKRYFERMNLDAADTY